MRRPLRVKAVDVLGQPPSRAEHDLKSRHREKDRLQGLETAGRKLWRSRHVFRVSHEDTVNIEEEDGRRNKRHAESGNGVTR